MSNPNELAQILAATFGENAQRQKEAEKALEQVEARPGGKSAYLHLITLRNLPLEVRQSAALRLKNICEIYWDVKKGDSNKIPEQDRNLIKQNMLEAILTEPQHKIRVQLLEALLWILKIDFPEHWPGLLEAILSNIQKSSQPQGDKARLFCALNALFIVIKRYQFKGADNRQPLNAVCDVALPLLLPILQNYAKQDSMEALEISRVILKSFYLAVQFSIPTILLKNPTMFGDYMSMCSTFLERRLPQEQAVALVKQGDVMKLNAHPLVRCQKWVTDTVYYCYARFGREKHVDSKDIKPFAKNFESKFAPGFLVQFMSLLKYAKEVGCLHARVIRNGFRYLEMAVYSASLFTQILSKNMRFLIQDAVLFTLCLTPSELNMLKEDPHEYIRRNSDEMYDYIDPRISASSFLIVMIQKRTSASLQLTLDTMTSTFNQFKQAPTNTNNIIQKEGAMRMLGDIRSLLQKKEQFNKPLESILIGAVCPELSSPHPFMRARALKTIGRFWRFPFGNQAQSNSKNKKQQQQQQPQQHPVYAEIAKACCKLLKDEELCVRLEAANTLSKLSRNKKYLLQLKPFLDVIFASFFEMIDDLGNEDVVATLRSVVHDLGADVAPYALPMVKKLCELIADGLQQAERDPDGMDESLSLTIDAAYRSLTVIADALTDSPDLIKQLELLCRKELAFCFTDKGFEFLDPGLDVLCVLTHYAPQVTPFMVECFHAQCLNFLKFSPDFLSSMLGSLNGLLKNALELIVYSMNPSKNPANFENGFGIGPNSAIYQPQCLYTFPIANNNVPVPPLLKTLIQCYERAMRMDSPIEHCWVAKHLQAFFSHATAPQHKGKNLVDFLMPFAFKIALTLLLDKKNQEPDCTQVRVWGCSLLSSMVLYNAPGFFKLMTTYESHDQMKAMLNSWLSHCEKAVEDYPMHNRFSVFGLCTLLSCCPFSAWPAHLPIGNAATDMLQILAANMKEWKRYEDEGEGEGDFEDGDFDDEEDFEDEDYDEDDIADGRFSDEDEETIYGIKDDFEDISGDADVVDPHAEAVDEEHVKDIQAAFTGLEDSEADEVSWNSPFDDLDPYIVFASTIELLSQREANTYQQWFRSLNADAKKKIQNYIKEAGKRKKDQEKKAKAEQEKKK